jgi:hypothetical protein
MRWVRSGYRVVIGSRSAAKAASRALELNTKLGEPGLIAGADNVAAAKQADLIVLTVPYESQHDILASIQPALAGKTLIDVNVAVNPDRPATVRSVAGGSAGQEAQEQLGAGVRVVAAFQNVSAEYLSDPDRQIDCDVLVCGDDAEAKVATMRLAEAAGLEAYDAGPLRNASVVEGLTAVLLGINKRYHSRLAGIRITGVSR